MRILILNWKDIKNPTGGGAEILTHEIAKGLVRKGNTVTLFSSLFNGGLKEERIDGVRIIRCGHPDPRYLFNSVYFLAYVHYFKQFKNNIDLVIDEVHGLPFFTPWYVKEKKIVLICEVAGSLWVKFYGKILGTIGRFIEIFYLKYLYRQIPYLAISNSTKNELIKNGVDEKFITVLPMGVKFPKNLKKYKKESKITCIIVGRMLKSKGIEDAIEAISELKKRNFKAILWIVGYGDRKYILYLHSLTKKKDLDENIIFYNFVTEQKKFELMSRAHLLLSPSIKEGFGLTVPEAGKVGTPAIVYNSPGLSEIVIDNKTGIICKNNTPQDLADNIIKLTNDNALYSRLSKGAKKYSEKYAWSETIKKFYDILCYYDLF